MFPEISRPEDVSILGPALDAFCVETGTLRGSLEHEDAGIRAMSLYQNGVCTVEDLTRALVAEWSANQPKYG